MGYREIVENYIGRKLKSKEIIHHKDGDSCNDNLDNLEITTQKEHHKKKHLNREDWESRVSKKLDDNFLSSILMDDFYQCLGVFFTPRMKDIIIKKLYSEKLSKTEKEYYSRVIKKRLYALTNSTLQRIANTLVFR